ncbi:MAG: Fe-S cluster assembly protein SufD [Nitrospira sp.]|nr:Fe-S cluster assembly protein SufD [Nitrospira sp.]
MSGTLKEIHLEQFHRLLDESNRNKGSGWDDPIRKQAISSLTQKGFPTPEDEDWRYTSIEPILQTPFEPARYEMNRLPAGILALPTLKQTKGHRIVVINGFYSQELSSLDALPKEVMVCSLAKAMSMHPDRVQPYFGRYADHENQAFVALNTALMEDGVFLYVPKGMTLENPIHLIFISWSGNKATISNPRSLMVLGANSQTVLVETYIGLEGESYFTNAVTELVGEENATILHCRFQNERQNAFHVATTQVHLTDNSQFTSQSISLGGVLARSDLNVSLDGEGINASLDGLYVASVSQHMDHHTRMDHRKPYGTSRQLYKGVLNGKSRGVFNGKIVVHKNAQRTDAAQVNRNLLLSGEAWANTKPELEIYADDVKCTHGSTVGQPDEDSVFYLCSRGIGQDQAACLLAYAFARDLIEQIRIELIRAELNNLLTDKIQRGEDV